MIIAVATRPKEGNKVNGDVWRFREFEKGILIALADGLGSGLEAYEAAREVVDFISRTHLRSEDELLDLVRGCHEKARRLRGATLGLAYINFQKEVLSFVGIGDIRAKIYGEREHGLLSMPGIVGRDIRRARKFEYPFSPGYILVMATDGICSWFKIGEFLPGISIKELAHKILEKYGREDDATVIAAKWEVER